MNEKTNPANDGDLALVVTERKLVYSASIPMSPPVFVPRIRLHNRPIGVPGSTRPSDDARSSA